MEYKRRNIYVDDIDNKSFETEKYYFEKDSFKQSTVASGIPYLIKKTAAVVTEENFHRQ